MKSWQGVAFTASSVILGLLVFLLPHFQLCWADVHAGDDFVCYPIANCTACTACCINTMVSSHECLNCVNSFCYNQASPPTPSPVPVYQLDEDLDMIKGSAGAYTSPDETFYMEWELVGDRIDVKMSAQTTGWLAVGFTKQFDTQITDIVVGHIDSHGTAIVSDRKSSPPHEGIPEVDDVSDVEVLLGGQEGGWTFLAFTRLRRTQDKFEDVMVDSAKFVVWAWGPGSIADGGYGDFLIHEKTGVVPCDFTDTPAPTPGPSPAPFTSGTVTPTSTTPSYLAPPPVTVPPPPSPTPTTQVLCPRNFSARVDCCG